MRFSEIAGKTGLFVDGDWIETKDQDTNGRVRLIQLADVGAGKFKNKSNKYITETKAAELLCTYLKKGDILIARLGEPLCKACIFPCDGLYITAVDVTILRVGNNTIEPKYLVYLINSPWFKVQVKRYESGTTRKRISRKNLDRICMNFPSLSEQKRIVAKIEELFSELDSGVETLRNTRQQLAMYRQALYASVYTENDMRPITDFFEISSGLTKNSKRNELPIKRPYLRVANVYYNELDLSEIKSIGVNENEIAKATLRQDDLLFVEGNGSKEQIGRVAIWDGSIKGCLHQNHIIKGRPLGQMLPQYALFYLISAYGRKQILDVASSTSGLYTLSANKVRNLRIPFLDSEKQKQCVSLIKERLSVCDSIEKMVDAALQQAEVMRQSILKKAFEGEL